MRHIANLNRAVKKDLTDKLVFKLRSELGDGMSHVNLWKEHKEGAE